ncbi:hypothetical protein AVEN_128290-1 [Araneus ventricosus]|uniref:Uncharacterized protein n=1 Tax=Araneus ventricosus TaxID=182803 RepID=A0A4Y2K1B0_ARAVE|nr:hypothetical protein AVEN_128290-1 [Araneus ventricosus]
MERDAAPESLLKIIYLATARKGARMLVVSGKQVLYVLPCALVLWEKLARTSDINLLEDSIEDEDDTPSSINSFICKDIEIYIFSWMKRTRNSSRA